MSKKKTTPARRPRTNAAEDTGIVLDLAAEQRKCELTARRVLAFINSDGPDYSFGAVAAALDAAVRKTGIVIWRETERGGEYDARAGAEPITERARRDSGPRAPAAPRWWH